MNLVYEEEWFLQNIVFGLSYTYVFLVFLSLIYMYKRISRINTSIFIFLVVGLSACLFVENMYGYGLDYIYIYLVLLLGLIFYVSKEDCISLRKITYGYMFISVGIVLSYKILTMVLNQFVVDILDTYNMGHISLIETTLFSINNKIQHIVNVSGVSVDNSIIYTRVYIFYYVFSIIALLFWMLMYKMVLNKHRCIDKV